MKKSALSPLVVAGVTLSMPLAAQADPFFDLEASFLVCLNSNCGEETSSEIITATADGMTLIYSDSPSETVGFIGIANPANPVALGSVPLSGEPTSVATVVGVDGVGAEKEYLLVAVNTSPDFDENFNNDHSGELQVFDIAACLAYVDNCAPVETIDLSGQPDSVAVSPNGDFAAIAIENERDEEACHTATGVLVQDFYDDEDGCLDAGNRFGEIPQPGAGFLAVIDKLNTTTPGTWNVDTVALTGLAGMYESSDPEPEYVHINSNNKAVVSLQENNAFVIVDLPTLTVNDSYSAGAVDLVNIDTDENDLIELKDDQPGRLREPDGVSWIGTDQFASANEGDLFGGSRGFTIFNVDGTVDFESFESFDYLQVMHGHYPEDRSENKGSEPEAVTYADFDGLELLFVASERSNTVAVYDFADKGQPWEPMQYLPAVMGPESVLAITNRADGNQVVAIANEVDDEARSMVNIYVLKDLPVPAYPTVASDIDPTPPGAAALAAVNPRFDRPIPWGALSGLTAGDQPNQLYAVHDSFYKAARIFSMDASSHPAMITGYTVLMRDGEEVDNYDLEGIAVAPGGGFWAVSEGAGNFDGSDNRPLETPNLLVRIAADGTVLEEVELPPDIAAKQLRFGFEGVAVTGSGPQERVYVAFQREWIGDPNGLVRIGEYRPHTGKWKFHWYPLDPREADSGWVGVSEIVAVGAREFLVLERDNQPGPFAAIKRIYHVDLDDGRMPLLAGTAGKGKGKAFPHLRKTLAYDLLPRYQAINGWVPEKPEGMTVDAAGNLFVVTDNDGVDDAPGQTWFFKIDNIAD